MTFLLCCLHLIVIKHFWSKCRLPSQWRIVAWQSWRLSMEWVFSSAGQLQPTPANSMGYLSPSSHQLAATSSSNVCGSCINYHSTQPAAAGFSVAHGSSSPPTASAAINARQQSQQSSSYSGGIGASNGVASSSSSMNGGTCHANGYGSGGSGSSSTVCNFVGCSGGRNSSQVMANGSSRGSGEWRLQLHLGQPPADTAVLAPLMAALQEIQVGG